MSSVVYTYSSNAAFVGILFVFGILGGCDGFFMGTKHTTPHSPYPKYNHKGKTYAKVGSQYVEYNDDEMYYDKHDRMKNQKEIDKEARDHFTAANSMDPSNSVARKEEKAFGEKAWKQVKREEVSDVTGLPMYEGETYNQYGKVEYDKDPEVYGNKQLGGVDEYEDEPPQPLNPFYGGPVPGGGLQHGGMNRQFFGNQHEPRGYRRVDEDYANYLKDPPRGILTLSPLSEEKPEKPSTATTTTEATTHNWDDYPIGMAKNISADDFEKCHGPDGNLNLMNYARNRKIIALNEARASYAMDIQRRERYPEFDEWVRQISTNGTTRQRTTTTTTTEFQPRADVTLRMLRYNTLYLTLENQTNFTNVSTKS
uniref:Uncharacterized protein n=1 Tax=Cacopsylla melanoneura TaxID=428564 RepID=A0A8D9BBJ0_9HEMI